MKFVVALVAVAGLAGAARADRLDLLPGSPVFNASNSRMAAADLQSQGGSPQDTGPAVYSSVPGPYAAPAASSFVANDDYTTSQPANSTFLLDGFKFVGGVTAAGMQLDFFFLDNTNTVVSSFGLAFPQSGNFVWTITFGTADPTVPAGGSLQVQAHTATDTGQWFLTTTAASPGSNSFSVGYGSTLSPARIAAFELQIPAPGSLALLGFGGVIAGRRRRR
jgi:hypothetical protein